MSPADKNSRRVAVINGSLLILASPIIALAIWERAQWSWPERMGLIALMLTIWGGGGALAIWWGRRKRMPNS